MAYSLKNHEDRIAELESKIGAGGGIIESSLTNPGYVKFANGFMMNWGFSPKRRDGLLNTNIFKKPFSTQCLAVTISPDIGNYDRTYTCVMSTNLTKVSFQTKHFDNFGAWWLAIGY